MENRISQFPTARKRESPSLWHEGPCGEIQSSEPIIQTIMTALAFVTGTALFASLAIVQATQNVS